METEAGPQMDLAVAKAVGFEARVIHDFARGAIVHIPTGRSLAGQSIMREFCPSVDANDAFEAADKFGLFRAHLLGRCPANPREWRIMESRGERNYIAIGPTAAVAICGAILKLSS